jgi:hypothetical protein
VGATAILERKRAACEVSAAIFTALPVLQAFHDVAKRALDVAGEIAFCACN